LKRQEGVYLSEFRVVKCKKCDAALTELADETLTKCVQCGYKFTMHTSESTKVTSKTNIKNLASPEVTNLVNKLRQFKTIKIEDNKSQSIKPKKSIGANIVKWYFILIFSMGVLSQCFNR
jgi:DNA-directed RNA polymerase subunit RPC12/RpoP